MNTRYGAFGGWTAQQVCRLVYGQSSSLDGTTVKDFYGNVIDHVEIIER